MYDDQAHSFWAKLLFYWQFILEVLIFASVSMAGYYFTKQSMDWGSGALIISGGFTVWSIILKVRKENYIKSNSILVAELEDVKTRMRRLLLNEIKEISKQLKFDGGDRISIHKWNEKDRKYHLVIRFCRNGNYNEKNNLTLEPIGHVHCAFNDARGVAFKIGATPVDILEHGFNQECMDKQTMKSCVIYCKTIMVEDVNSCVLTVESTTPSKWSLRELTTVFEEPVKNMGYYVGMVGLEKKQGGYNGPVK